MTFTDPLLGMRIVVLDDEPANVELLDTILCDAGYSNVETTTSPAAAISSCAALIPDVLLLDLHMPGIDGFGVMRKLGPTIRTNEGPAVLVLTADATQATRRRALDAGARDYVSKPFDHAEVLLRVRNLLAVRHGELRLAEHNQRLDRMVQTRTRDLEASRLEVLDRLALVAEFRDDDTNEHARRVGRRAAALAAELGLPPELLEMLGPAAALHDIGKIAIPDAILGKPGSLTDEEFAVMRTHTTIGARMLADSCFPILQIAATIALTHHERFDGTGYPARLAGNAIPLEGRITAVADVYDAMTSDRVYRPAFAPEDAIEMMREERGRQFDPVILDAMLAGTAPTRTRRSDRAGRASQTVSAGPPLLDGLDPREHAFDSERFQNSLQPVIDLNSGAIVLWRSGSSASRNGGAPSSLTVAIGRDTRARIDWATLRLAFLKPTTRWEPILVSASPHSLQDDQGQQLLRDYSPAASAVAISLRGRELAQVVDPGSLVRELRELGYTVALEDFGTCEGSLELASSCQLDFVIPSASMWDQVEASTRQHVLVKSLAELAHGLGARLLIGPIETPEQLETLGSIGIDLGYGTAVAAATDRSPAEAATNGWVGAV